METNHILHRNVKYYYDGHNANFWSSFAKGWESGTFDCFDKFLDKNKTFLDIGSWIGPTVLYASGKSKQVYSVEPNPDSLVHLKKNIKLNNLNNISIIEKAIYHKETEIDFVLAESASNLLINDSKFIEEGSAKDSDVGKRYNVRPKVKVSTITFKTLLSSVEGDISLIKMDIEGAEKYVIPECIEDLKLIECPLNISLHWAFLKEDDILKVLNELSKAYSTFYDVSFNIVNIQEILSKKINMITCTKNKIV